MTARVERTRYVLPGIQGERQDTHRLARISSSTGFDEFPGPEKRSDLEILEPTNPDTLLE